VIKGRHWGYSLSGFQKENAATVLSLKPSKVKLICLCASLGLASPILVRL
jgi:hypothetical protein